MLERNNDNITAALKGLAKYHHPGRGGNNSGFRTTRSCEPEPRPDRAAPSDYALGFRRGRSTLGQPPGQRWPRAEILFPTTAYRNPTSVGAAMTRRPPSPSR